MPWTSADKERIRNVLDYSANKINLDYISTSMAVVASESPDAIITIQGLLTQAETQLAAINTGAEDKALIKAGSLAWDVRYKSSVMSGELNRIKQSIANALGLYLYVSPSSHSQGLLVRS